jgi:hypothetical protein
MYDELTATKESVTEVLLKLRTKRVMSEQGLSTGLQESSTRGLASSPSTAHTGSSRPTDEKRTKHRYDLTNAKLIPRILPTYIPPLSSAINHDNVPQEFEYAVITVYLPKGVRAVRANQDKLTALKFSDFNLGYRKSYSMFSLQEFKDYRASMDPKPRVFHTT